jgi:hypothetical protein
VREGIRAALRAGPLGVREISQSVSWVDLEEKMPPGPDGLPATIGLLDADLGWIAAGRTRSS